MTAFECLSLPVFDPVRDKKLEKILSSVNPNHKIKLDIDHDDAFDYDDVKNAKFSKEMLIEKLCAEL